MTHPWHDLSPGEHAPQRMNAIIEIPKEGKGKHELHKESGLLMLDRALFSGKQPRRFFMDYKTLEGKEVVVEKFPGREEAMRIVQESVELYVRTFGA